MAGEVENMVLEHPKRFQGTLDRIEQELREFKTRQNETHSAVTGLRRNQVQDAEISAMSMFNSIRSRTGSTALSGGSN